MKCRICDRKSTGELCELHEEACTNLQKKYESWERALEISWDEYLEEMQTNPYAGLWVKEVARYLLSSGTPQDQTLDSGQSE